MEIHVTDLGDIIILQDKHTIISANEARAIANELLEAANRADKINED